MVCKIKFIKNKKNLEKFFGDKKFIKVMLYLFLPSALQSLVTVGITYVDNFFIAEFANEGSAAKTALGLVGPAIVIPQFILIGFLSGVGVMTAQFFGSNENEKIKETIVLKIMIGIIIGTISMIVMMSLAKEIVNVISISNNTTVKGFANIYLFWSGISMVPLGIVYALDFSLKETKQPIVPLVASIVAMTSNIILDPLFIMDASLSDSEKIRNIAITTALARTIEASIIIGWLFFKKNNCSYFFKTRKVSLTVIRKVLSSGWQIVINESLYGFVNAFLIISTFHYNPELEDAMTTYSLLAQFSSLVWPGTASICAVLVGAELGKGDTKQALYNSRKALNWSFILSGILAFSVFIVSLFINELLSPNATPEMIQITKEIEYVLIPVIFIQGPFAIMFFSQRSGGSKYLITIDALSSVVWCALMAIIVYIPGIKQRLSPIVFIIILELDQVIKLICAGIAYKWSNWTKNLTIDLPKKQKLINN